MAKEDTLKPILDKLNITQWRNVGFTGKGITIWNTESATSSHGKNSRQVILDVAPDTNIITGSFGFSTSGEIITTLPTVDTEDGNKIGLYDFIKDNKIKYISTSLKGTNNPSKEWVDYVKKLRKDFGIIVHNAAGNEGSEGGETLTTRWPVEDVFVIGALYFNKVFTRAPYSSVGEELDFSQSVAWWSGTSAATPFQAGMTAMIIQRYGDMSFDELYKYLVMICDDLGDEGDDIYYGNGQPVLPNLSKKYITLVINEFAYMCDGQVKASDTVPVLKNDRTFVPVRLIAESLGYTVKWNKPKITISKGGFIVTLKIGSKEMFIDGDKSLMDVAPFIDGNNRTLVPIRFVAEAFNCSVDWIENESKVMILER